VTRSFLNRLTLSALLLFMSSSVWASGRAVATAWLATMLPALGLFSATTGWPSGRPIAATTTGAVISPMPPWANGTSSETGRSRKRLWA